MKLFVAVAATLALLSANANASAPPFYAVVIVSKEAAMGEVVPTWSGIVESTGQRFAASVEPSSITANSLAPDRPSLVLGNRLVNVGHKSRVVGSCKGVALGAGGRVACVTADAIRVLRGPTIHIVGLPKGASVRNLAVAPRSLSFAATVVWGGPSESSHGYEAIYVISPSGAARKLVGGFQADCEDPEPIWNPQGDRIAFEKQIDCQRRAIYVVKRDGSGLERISYERDAYGASWSPDGTRLLYTARYGYVPRKSNGSYDVCVATLAGVERRLTFTPPSPPPTGGVGNWISPGAKAGAWSPDGSTIAYVIGTSGWASPQRAELATVPAQGGSPTVVATFTAPASPSGDELIDVPAVWWPKTS